MENTESTPTKREENERRGSGDFGRPEEGLDIHQLNRLIEVMGGNDGQKSQTR